MAETGKIAEIAVFGGSAIALMFDFRDSTLDVDVMPISGDISLVKEISRQIAAEDDELPEDWLNDAVEIFKSDNCDYQLMGEFPPEKPDIRVFTATPEYIFAMKVLAMRSSLEAHDVFDIWNLIDKIGISSHKEGKKLVEKYYPDRELPQRNDLILMDIFEEKEKNSPYSATLGW